MASKQDNLVPVLLLGGLAVFLMYQRGMLGGAGKPAPAAAIRASASDKLNSIGNALSGFFTYLGGATNDGNHSSARPSDAALAQVIAAANAWQATSGAVAGEDGDPYGEW